MNAFIVDRKRVNRICNKFFKTGLAPKEMRGGARRSDAEKVTLQSIRNFISRLKPVESHYNRSKSNRLYLSPLLSCRQLWRAWKDEYLAETPDNPRLYSYKQFHHIFVTEYNIAFGMPRTDLCSTCVKYEAQIKAKENSEEATLQLKLHRLRAKQFYALHKQEMKTQGTVTVAFDLQQNLPLPRTNIGEAFYRRQLWLYNFGIVFTGQKQTSKMCFYTHGRKLTGLVDPMK